MKTSTKVALGLGAIAAVGAVVLAKKAAEGKDGSSPAPGPSASPSASSSSKGPSGKGVELGNKKNVTDEQAPAPPDVNDPAPPGSHIVGWKTDDGVSPETNRILNLRERWNRIAKWGQQDPKTGGFKRLLPDEVVKYDAWRVFGNTNDGRMLRSMVGWETQFLSLESVEDAIHARSPGFVVDRRDVTLLPHQAGT